VINFKPTAILERAEHQSNSFELFGTERAAFRKFLIRLYMTSCTLCN